MDKKKAPRGEEQTELTGNFEKQIICLLIEIRDSIQSITPQNEFIPEDSSGECCVFEPSEEYHPN